MNPVFEQMSRIGIIPVIALDDAGDAAPLAEALLNGGISCAEVTFRTAAAEETIRKISEDYPEMLVGAGTVLTTEQADSAVAAGAKFIVSPGLNPVTVKYCQAKGVPVIPGIMTPSEIELALSLGLTEVKFFPAEAAGGVAMLKAMSAPYGNMRFIPTGGIDLKNLSAYTALPSVLACGGSFLVKKEWLANREYAKITTMARQAIGAMLRLRMGHIGVIAQDAEECRHTAQVLSDLLLAEKTGNAEENAFMIGDYFEILLHNTNGERGHVCIRTNDVPRAAAYFRRMGVELLEETAQYEADGTLRLIYCKDTWCGMGLHLLKTLPGEQ